MFEKSNPSIRAEVIECSAFWQDVIQSDGSAIQVLRKIFTFLVWIPKWLSPELLTYRTVSRNAGSSRAKPTNYLLDLVKNNPFVPITWEQIKKVCRLRKKSLR